MRIVKSKLFLSDVMNTEHEIHFVQIDPKRVYSRAYSTRIAEVSDPGKPGERELPIGTDRGLLWRMYGYWFFEERDGGVVVECESVTLTRDVPFGIGKVALADYPRIASRITPQRSRVNAQCGLEPAWSLVPRSAPRIKR
jgi:hypothetical protein